jgi:Zn-dependent peptidase ImmA (M78 family)
MPILKPGRHVIENHAHRFAAAFLMPAETIAKEFPHRMSWPEFIKLKERWRVSHQALFMRAKTLGALGSDGYG